MTTRTRRRADARLLDWLLEAVRGEGGQTRPWPASPPPSASWAHLTDDEFVAYAMALAGPAERGAMDSHVAGCVPCALEIRRLTRVGAAIEDGAYVEHLRRQVAGALEWRRPEAAPARGRPGFIWLGALRPHGAYGQDDAPSTARREFPVLEAGVPVEGLRGVLEQKGGDYYVMVSTTSDDLRPRFAGRMARLLVLSGESGAAVVDRRLEIGVATLVGTDSAAFGHGWLGAELVPQPSGGARPT